MRCRASDDRAFKAATDWSVVPPRRLGYLGCAAFRHHVRHPFSQRDSVLIFGRIMLLQLSLPEPVLHALEDV